MVETFQAQVGILNSTFRRELMTYTVYVTLTGSVWKYFRTRDERTPRPPFSKSFDAQKK